MKKRILNFILILILILCAILVIYMFKQNRKQVKELENNMVESSNSEEEVIYKTVSSYDEVINYIRVKDKSMIVLGKDNCIFCSRFIPVLLDIKKEYDFDFLYINFTTLSDVEYDKFIEGDIVIPKKCTSGGKDRRLNEGIGTPTSLIYENGKVIDCINGYKDYDNTINILKNFDMIKD